MDKATRLESLLPGGRGVWIPIDHGASDYPIDGLQDLEQTISALVRAGVDAIVAQKGVVSAYAPLCEGTKTSMVVHYSVSTRHGGPNSDNKVLVGHADETLSRGGIGVSSQINLGSMHEATMTARSRASVGVEAAGSLGRRHAARPLASRPRSPPGTGAPV